MAEPIITTIGYLLGFAFIVVAAYYRSQLSKKEQQNESLAKQLDKQGAKLNKLENKLKSNHEESTAKKDKSVRLEKDFNQLKALLVEKQKQWDIFKEEQSTEVDRYKSIALRAKEQQNVLLTQLAEMDEEKNSLRHSLENATVKAEEAQSKAYSKKIQTLQTSLNETKKKNKELEQIFLQKEKKLGDLTDKLKDFDPSALKKAKIKISRYSHLYHLMKGHKEMVEERNNNWELALKLLSTWVLKQSQPGSEIPTNLGTLVASALDATKSGPLVDDSAELARQHAELMRHESKFNLTRDSMDKTDDSAGKKLKKLVSDFEGAKILIRADDRSQSELNRVEKNPLEMS